MGIVILIGWKILGYLNLFHVELQRSKRPRHKPKKHLKDLNQSVKKKAICDGRTAFESSRIKYYFEISTSKTGLDLGLGYFSVDHVSKICNWGFFQSRIS